MSEEYAMREYQRAVQDLVDKYISVKRRRDKELKDIDESIQEKVKQKPSH